MVVRLNRHLIAYKVLTIKLEWFDNKFYFTVKAFFSLDFFFEMLVKFKRIVNVRTTTLVKKKKDTKNKNKAHSKSDHNVQPIMPMYSIVGWLQYLSLLLKVYGCR